MKKLSSIQMIRCSILLALCLCQVSVNNLKAQLTNQIYGITLCGAEFGEKNLPGTLGIDYTYPNNSDIDYFASKGIDLIQLPFKWERIQRVPGEPLDPTELSHIKEFVDKCAAKKIKVNLVLQNFGRYQLNGNTYVVGSYDLPAAYLVDFWKRMARAMFDKQNVFAFAIMTEPHDMGSYKWASTVQQVINGIREVDKYTTILVDGDNYSNPATWEQYNYDLKNIVDVAGKTVFNAHCYFDNDYSGKYAKSYDADGAYELTGVERMKPFVDWLNKYNKRGYVGEFGIPKKDKRWITVMNYFLDYLQQNNIGASYWAAGSWWKDYELSVQPINSADQPQMIAYSKFFNKNFVRNY
ncbi:MAG: cellulase family glycosylhydrolase [Bacteroidetes bacterium]|nr:cellulase family glycosylhydrolase [Bacteroidota bacterium]